MTSDGGPNAINLLHEIRGQLDPRVLAEPDVDQRDVGRQLLDELAALLRRARRADDRQTLAIEQELQALPEGLVVLNQYEAERRVRWGNAGNESPAQVCGISVPDQGTPQQAL